MLRTLILAVGLVLGAETLLAQAQLSDAVKGFVRVDAPLVALEHVRVIDGTGAPPAEDQTVVIENGPDPRSWKFSKHAGAGRREGARPQRVHGYSRSRRHARPPVLPISPCWRRRAAGLHGT